VLAGQHVLGLLTTVATNKLAVLDNLCLAVIGRVGTFQLVDDSQCGPRNQSDTRE
jgi:hypothetical protein